MEPSELPSTASGSFRVLNYTRYNTDDLIALVNAVERVIPTNTWRHGRPVLSNTALRVGVQGKEPVLTFKVFTGAPRENSKWNGQHRQIINRRLMAPSRWRYPLEMRCIPPEKVHANPIESLAASTAEQEVLPASMVAEIVEKMTSLYEHWQYKYGSQTPDQPVISGLMVRIERKRAATEPKRTKRTVALERLERTRQEATYRVPQHTRTVDNVLTLSRRTVDAAAVLNIPTEELRNAAKAMRDAVAVFHAALQAVGEQGLKEVG